MFGTQSYVHSFGQLGLVYMGRIRKDGVEYVRYRCNEEQFKRLVELRFRARQEGISPNFIGAMSTLQDGVLTIRFPTTAQVELDALDRGA